VTVKRAGAREAMRGISPSSDFVVAAQAGETSLRA